MQKITFKKPCLVMLQGLPASGKTTWTKEQVKNYQKVARVNKDDLRAMTKASLYSKPDEKIVLELRDKIIESYLTRGYSVIVDDTNFLPHHEETLKKLAKLHSVNFITKYFDTDLETCIRRDAQREKRVGREVIEQMENQRKRYQIIPYEPDETKPKAVIFDIDGTIAKMSDRSPYDYSRVSEDAVYYDIVWFMKMFQEKGYKIIIVSGREASCLQETKDWILNNNVPVDFMFLRKKGDHRKDNIVKYEIFNENIRNYYCVEYVFDDRNQVVEMWRKLGLRTLQVADGDF